MARQVAEDICFLAKVYGWELDYNNPEFGELRFSKGSCSLAIWCGKMMVQTVLVHPKLGETKLFRKRVSMGLLEEIFNNPRVHTNRGYMRKR